MDQKFKPLLFAGDINVCSVARAFHEEYGIRSDAYGKYPTGPCMGSKIINYRDNEKADEQETFLELVNGFAAANRDYRILLIGCGDSYVQLMSQNRGSFPENVIAPYIPIDLMNELIHKESFYKLCEATGVDYPETFVHHPKTGLGIQPPFEGPYIIKPSNGIEYWRHPYPAQKKVYKEDSWEGTLRVLEGIYASGYADSVIVQNFIPGDDTYMRVLTNYSDWQGKVKLMCLGHVLLEEHTPHGLGNHAVIITEQNAALEAQLKSLLEGVGYVGFSNFDIKYDQRDGKYKVLELNARQGRSNYYVTGAGANIARYLVDDYILEKPFEFQSVSQESLWMVVPRRVAFQYIKEPEYRQRMKALIRAGNVVNPLLYRPDNGLVRKIRIWRNILRHFSNYKKYLGKE